MGSQNPSFLGWGKKGSNMESPITKKKKTFSRSGHLFICRFLNNAEIPSLMGSSERPHFQ